MTIGMPTGKVVDVLDEIKEFAAYRQEFTLWPRRWEEYASSHGWRLQRLKKSMKNKIPDGPGIYTLVLQPGIAGHNSCSYLMYVGKAVSLRTRFDDYLGKEKLESGRPKMFRFLNMYEGYVWFCYTTVRRSFLNKFENRLIYAYIPPLNDQITGRIGRIVRAFR
jgi:hypothetical protein